MAIQEGVPCLLRGVCPPECPAYEIAKRVHEDLTGQAPNPEVTIGTITRGMTLCIRRALSTGLSAEELPVWLNPYALADEKIPLGKTNFSPRGLPAEDLQGEFHGEEEIDEARIQGALEQGATEFDPDFLQDIADANTNTD